MATSAIPQPQLVREQFTHEQWEHFPRTRRFVEEVLPEGTEAVETPIVGRDITGIGAFR